MKTNIEAEVLVARTLASLADGNTVPYTTDRKKLYIAARDAALAAQKAALCAQKDGQDENALRKQGEAAFFWKGQAERYDHISKAVNQFMPAPSNAGKRNQR